MKKVKKRKSGEEGPPYKPSWRLFECLTFLQDSIRHREYVQLHAVKLCTFYILQIFLSHQEHFGTCIITFYQLCCTTKFSIARQPSTRWSGFGVYLPELCSDVMSLVFLVCAYNWNSVCIYVLLYLGIKSVSVSVILNVIVLLKCMRH